MKPANFPERRRQRQLGALARLRTMVPTPRILREIAALTERAAKNLRSARTRKSGTREQRRRAWRR